MSDETKVEPKGPDELWGLWSEEYQEPNGSVLFDDELLTYASKQSALRDAGKGWQPVLIGVSPAIRDALIREVSEWSRKAGFAEGRADGLEIERDALRAEVAEKDAEIDALRLSRLNWTSVAAKAQAEIASLKAELELRKHDADECCKAEKSVRKMLAAAMTELATLRGEGPIRVGDVVQVDGYIEPTQAEVMHIYYAVRQSNGYIRTVNGSQIVRMPDGTPVDQ